MFPDIPGILGSDVSKVYIDQANKTTRSISLSCGKRIHNTHGDSFINERREHGALAV
jgi:hypothetical protein